VVDVTHHGDDGRAADQVGLVVLGGRELSLLLRGGDDLGVALELLRDRPNLLVGERLRQGRHLALLHQGLDDLGRREPQALGHLTHGRTGGDGECRRLLGLLRSLVLGLLQQRAPPPATAAPWRAGRRLSLGDVVAAGGLGVDHHAPAALGTGLRSVSCGGGLRRLRGRGAGGLLRSGAIPCLLRLRSGIGLLGLRLGRGLLRLRRGPAPRGGAVA